MGETSFHMLQAFAALLFVLGLIALCAFFLRRSPSLLAVLQTKSSGKSRLLVKESTMLDARHRVSLLSCDNTEFLVAYGAGEPVLLASWQLDGKKMQERKCEDGEEESRPLVVNGGKA